jgi:hypothetical protein
VITQCQEQRLRVSDWNIILFDPKIAEEDTDYSYGDGIGAAAESIWELLQLHEPSQFPTTLRLGQLIAQVEETFLEHWRLMTAVNITDEQVFDMLGRAVGKPLTGDEAIAELIPEAQLAGFWEKLPEQWGSLWPAVAMKTNLGCADLRALEKYQCHDRLTGNPQCHRGLAVLDVCCRAAGQAGLAPRVRHGARGCPCHARRASGATRPLGNAGAGLGRKPVFGGANRVNWGA